MSFTDVMIDIETLGTQPGCAILSIGILEFCPKTAKFGREIEMVLDGQDQLDKGATVSMGTIEWWIREAAAVWPRLGKTRDEMWQWNTALAQVVDFCRGRERIWAQGPHFDMAILNSSWKLLGCEGDCIEEHWKVRDCRTIAEVAGVYAKRVKGQHHNALQDCRAQANAVIQAWGKMGKGGINVA